MHEWLRGLLAYDLSLIYINSDNCIDEFWIMFGCNFVDYMLLELVYVCYGLDEILWITCVGLNTICYLWCVMIVYAMCIAFYWWNMMLCNWRIIHMSWIMVIWLNNWGWWIILICMCCLMHPLVDLENWGGETLDSHLARFLNG